MSRPRDEHASDATPRDSTPADDLGELWQALDSLPQAEPPDDLLATTIEMVAVQAGTTGLSLPRRSEWFAGIRREIWHWLAPAATVLAAIAGGFWLGQATSPQPTTPRSAMDWRSVREEMMKQTIRETIENNPAAKQFIKNQIRDAVSGQGRPPARPPQWQPLGQLPGKRFEGPNRPRPEDGRRPPPAFPKKKAGPRKRFPEPPREQGGPLLEPPPVVPAEESPPSSS